MKQFQKYNVRIVNWIIENPDKVAHYLVGLFLGMILSLFSIFAVLGVIPVAIWKEWLDHQTHGKPDYKDFYATILGGLTIGIYCGILMVL